MKKYITKNEKLNVLYNEKIKCKECGNPSCSLKGKDVLVPYCNEHVKIKNN